MSVELYHNEAPNSNHHGLYAAEHILSFLDSFQL
jgi:hypothetical protein